jgi:hypothetical protein
MTTTRRKTRQIAASKLTHVGDNIRDINREIDILSREIEIMVIKKEDAKWGGHTALVSSLRYHLMIKNTARNMLNKRKAKVMKEVK